MEVRKNSARNWDTPAAFSFILSVCFVCWSFSFAAAFGPDFRITITSPHFAVDTKFIFLNVATFLPALYCFVTYPEVKASLSRVSASWQVYFAAIATGLSLPFLGYPGTHYYDFPWGREVAMHLGEVFVWNIFLTPFWEEIVWRACFLNKVRSFLSAPTAILFMSVGWTFWHLGYISFLYSGGIPINALRFVLLTYFCGGIIFGSIFEMSRRSIWPSVLMHTSFNSATVIYYTPHDRVHELSSYESEMIFAAILAAAFLWLVVRQNRGMAVD